MPRKVVLTGRILSFEETAKVLGVSQKRAREIAALMDAIMERRDRTAGTARRKESAKGAEKAVRRVPRARTRAARA